MAGYVGEVNIVGDWIYYANLYSGGLYRMKTDGSSNIKVITCIAQHMTVVNGWIYFLDNSTYKRARVDGTCEISLGFYNASFYNIAGDYIYYIDNTQYNNY